GDAPPPASATFADLMAARYHYQRVNVIGIGRSIRTADENRTVLRIAMGDRQLEVKIDAPPPENRSTYIDARLSVTGLAAGSINDRRQLTQPYLRVPNWQSITIADPAPRPEEMSITPVAGLLRFQAGGEEVEMRRVRISGVTLAVLAEHTLFLRDPDSPAPPRPNRADDTTPPRNDPSTIAIHLDEEPAVKVGQRVEVIGFPAMEKIAASLADAELAKIDPNSPAEPPKPTQLTIAEVFANSHDADLVQVSAKLQDSYITPQGTEMRLQSSTGQLRALLPGAAPTLPDGAILRLTGICRVESSFDKGFRSNPDSVSIWLRGSDDLVILSSPSSWTVRRLLYILAALLGILLLGGIWISLLRRRLAAQSAALSASIAQEAKLDERQRIAREFHDTLEQELAGLCIRLDAATSRPVDEKARQLLENSRHLVTRIQSGARNLVSDLRSDEDETLDLPTSLRELISRQSEVGPQVTFQADGPAEDLPAVAAHHLRMIAQEALTNALKHAQAQNIAIRLERTNGGITLCVLDDGIGLQPDFTEGKPGHFGCMGMRERARKIGADIQWLPAQPHGTQVVIRWRAS
ncbi:MAG: sensor histidine kinase, partial [Verrucomicrobiales bacterium]|nr:sensor histidine kinase [Verrucomicrobiales bacterium]